MMNLTIADQALPAAAWFRTSTAGSWRHLVEVSCGHPMVGDPVIASF